jgi:hypothetical protein
MSAASANLRGNTVTQTHYHAFLCHNGAEKPAVRDLAAKLEERGLTYWLDQWNLIPGNSWQPAIEEALGQCDTCVDFIGPHGLRSWHNEEMRLAIQRRVSAKERKLRVLPVILPGGGRAKESELPGFLQGTTWVECEEHVYSIKLYILRLFCGRAFHDEYRDPSSTVLQLKKWSCCR